MNGPDRSWRGREPSRRTLLGATAALFATGGCLAERDGDEPSAGDDAADEGADGCRHELPSMDPERMESVYADVVDEVPDAATVVEAADTCLADDDVIQTLFDRAVIDPDDTDGQPRTVEGQVAVDDGEVGGGALYCAAACLYQFEFSNTPQGYDDGVYVRDRDVVLAFGYHGLD